MGVALSTLGVRVGYAFANKPTNSSTDIITTRPTTGYTVLKDVKDVPDFNPSPDAIEVTPLINTDYKTYIHGLKDLGGDLAFLANFTQELFDLYNSHTTGTPATGTAGIIQEYFENGKVMWMVIDHPGLTKSLYINVAPSRLGLNAMQVNSGTEVTLHFAPLGEPIWEADPVSYTNYTKPAGSN